DAHPIYLRTPTAGSPKVATLQATPPVKVRGLVKVPFAPKLTSSEPEKAHCVFSQAQKVQPGLGVGLDVVIGRVSHHLRTPGSGSPKTELLQATPPVKVRGVVKVPFAPKLTWSEPEKEHCVFSQAQKVQPGRGVGVVVTGCVSHHLRTPRAGSPKVAVLQATPPVKVLGLVKVPFAPKLTWSEPEKEHCVFSQAQKLQPGRGVGLDVV